MTLPIDSPQNYYPPPESAGGWRTLTDSAQARAVAGIDLTALAPARAWNAQYGVASVVVIIRRGYLVAEWYENGAAPDTRFNIYSCTKSFTGTAYGLLFDAARRPQADGPASAAPVELDSPAYAYIPAGYPLTDPRKAEITLRHLLSMSSGIPGENIGAFGVRVRPGVNAFEAALGFQPALSRDLERELWAGQLSAAPGAQWEYSDPAFAHLSLAFRGITGEELHAFMERRIFQPIGIKNLGWETLGVDDDRLGKHTNPFSTIHISGRELARFGYLLGRGGNWENQPLVAPWWIALSTQTSQPYEQRYGLTWWVNTQGTLWPAAPRDAFSALGFNTNLCCVIPSLDLVVVRLGLGPTDSAEDITSPFIAAIVNALVPDEAQ